MCVLYFKKREAGIENHCENLTAGIFSPWPQELDKTQDELMKHQTNISELKRTFLETSTETALTNEWEKRLSTSPVRLAARQEDAPMIEPLMPEEVSIWAVG